MSISAMVGDGANDCGALKAAHTGISLSDTESSVASPFTSRETNISCLVTVIREGRAALVTSFGIFKYMASYSLTQFISVMLLYHIESNLTDFEFLYIDLVIISTFAFFFGRTKAYDGPLVKTPPLNSLISTAPVLSLVLQLVGVGLFQYTGLWHLRQMEWFVPFNATLSVDGDKDDVGCQENYTIFVISSMQYIILALVFSKGRPYRKSLVTNYGILISSILMCCFSVYLSLGPADWIVRQFELVIPSDLSFRFVLLAYGGVNFLVAMFLEYVIVDYIVFGKLRYRWHNVEKSRRKFLAIEREMSRDFKWPPISQEPLPEAAPDILIRSNQVTEIKIEKRETETCNNANPMFINSPDYGNFKRFSSAREVTLNPRTLFNEDSGRTTVSMANVPSFENREMVSRQMKLGVSPKRRHNSESENGVNGYNRILMKKMETNPIATLPRNSTGIAPRNIIEHRNSKDTLRNGFNSVELDILPS